MAGALKRFFKDKTFRKGVLGKVGNFVKKAGSTALNHLGTIAGTITKNIPGGEKYAATVKNIGDVISGAATGNVKKIKEGIKNTKAGDIATNLSVLHQATKNISKDGGQSFIDQAKKTWTETKQAVGPTVQSVKDKRALNALQEASQIFSPK